MSDTTTSSPEDVAERRRAYLLLAIMPLFFSSNIIFGRAAVDEVEPFTLAFIRWSASALILSIITAGAVRAAWPRFRAAGRLLFINAFLGMWICGALVYLALKYTSATNGTLIYTSSPVLIILIEWLFRGRAVNWREIVGITAALIGVVVTPSGSISNRTKEMPLCLAASKSVRTRQKIQSACWASVVQIFEPLRM